MPGKSKETYAGHDEEHEETNSGQPYGEVVAPPLFPEDRHTLRKVYIVDTCRDNVRRNEFTHDES